MNYKIMLTLWMTTAMAFWAFTSATQSDQQLVEELEKLEPTPSLSSQNREYESFASCEDFETTLQKFIDDNKDLRARPYPIMYATDDMMVDSEMAAQESVNSPARQAVWRWWWDEDWFSTTNLQVSWVDEPEILKTDGEFFYYYSQQLGQIYILDHTDEVIQDSTLQEALSSIEVPSTLSNIQLFLQDDTLTIIWNRWSQASGRWLLDNWQKTVVSVFDVSDPSSPKLDALHDLDGYVQDSRMIDGELTLITWLWVNRWRWFESTSSQDEVDLSTLRPTQRSVIYDKNGNLDIQWKAFPYSLTSSTADCNSIQYLFPTQETLKQSQAFPSFTTVYTIDTESTTQPKLTTLFGNTEQIHMSNDNLYLTAGQRLPSGSSSCPINARCLFPNFWTQQTLIHKYELDGMKYDGSVLIDGAPLPQRSMSESTDEEFRILTRQWSPTSATHLTILDNDMDLKGSLKNIEPGEEFKASRYIGDKLYLVTFEQIDPLFVIDLEDSENPTIMWELKIPGYSTYLHPYDSQDNGVQHLIGLGYDTAATERWGTTTAWVKVDLYTIDYNQSPISIEQTHTLTMWEQGSWTEVAENPRQFVWNPQTKTLLLPVVLTEAIKGSNCQVFYDANGQEETRDCYETIRESTTFAWLKEVTIDLENWISEQSLIDLKPLISQFKNMDMYGYEYEQDENGSLLMNPWMLRNLMMRVWFVGNETYMFTNQSVTFADGNNEKTAILNTN